MVEQIDLDQRRVRTSEGDIEYDYLALAAGSVNNFFGNRYQHDRRLVDRAMAALPQAEHGVGLVGEYMDVVQRDVRFRLVDHVGEAAATLDMAVKQHVQREDLDSVIPDLDPHGWRNTVTRDRGW